MKPTEYATFKTVQPYLEWIAALECSAADDLLKQISEDVKSANSDVQQQVKDSANRMFCISGGYSNLPGDGKEDKWIQQRQNRIKFAKQYLSAALEDSNAKERFRVNWHNERFAAIYAGNPDVCLIVPRPDEHLAFEQTRDFSDLPPALVCAELQIGPEFTTELVPAQAGQQLTTKQVSEQLNNQNEKLNQLRMEMEQVRKAETGELAELQAKIDAMKRELDQKKDTLMTELQKKKMEMEETKEKLEMQIYLLDSQIYSILCYAGEVVQFRQIRKGIKASDTEPIIVHQKLRFLDEDLGMLASLYHIEWDDIDMFEDLLRYNPTALETFAPNPRCISLVRLSRTGKQLARNGDVQYANMLKWFGYYHGKTVGILVRNGDNLYLGWTDEERIHIDDDLIISQVVTEVLPATDMPKFTFESDRERYIKEQKENRKKILDGLVSRSFIYNILQGLIDNTPLLPLPDGVTLGKQSEYVKYAIADRWLNDNRFGNFTDIIARCNERILKGDMLLTVQYLRPERYSDFGNSRMYGTKPWENVRGRGDRNRTHDCHVDDCTIYPANLVEFDPPVSKTRFRRLITPSSFEINYEKQSPEPKWKEMEVDTDTFERHYEKSDDCEVIEVFDFRRRHVFVSTIKADTWYYESDARANFEVHDDEIINLTYMNSVWLQWAIMNKKVGGWCIGDREVDYAYAIRYLKKAMDFVSRREEEEKQILDTIDHKICEDPEWPLKLTEWKLECKVRTITEYQARRYHKYWVALKGGANKTQDT